MSVSSFLYKICSLFLVASLVAGLTFNLLPAQDVQAGPIPGFAAPVNYTVNTNPAGVTSGDFNRDGLPDLAVANQGSNTVSILLGTGSGALAAALNFATGGQPVGIAAGDFNGDAILDLVTTNTETNSIMILRGSGSGSFAVTGGSSTGTGPRWVATGDFNRDGQLDLAVANSLSNNISVLLGSGSGSFALAVNYAAGNGPTSLVVRDFNRDGRLDLATANEGSDNLSVLLGVGDGTFGAAVNYAAGSQPTSIASGDFDQNGTLDLVASNTASGSLSVLLGSGAGTFAAATSIMAPLSPSFVLVSDINSDSLPDLAVVDSNWNSINLFAGNGDGTFLMPVSVNTGLYPYALAAADFDLDGRLDLATSNRAGDSASLLLNTHERVGSGYYQSAVNYPVGGAPQNIAADDFNRDGKLDLVMANRSNNNIDLLLGNNDGTFQSIVSYPTGANPQNTASGDFNRDGILDLAVSQFSADSIGILLGTGTGSFASVTNVSTGTGSAPEYVVAGDFNNDAILDLVANYSSGEIVLLSGNGDGTFQAPAAIGTTGLNVWILVAGDLNMDGRLDLVVPDFNTNTIGVILNNGGGTFAARVNYTAEQTPEDVAIGDFNGDGRQDLAVTYSETTVVSIYRGNGDGTFQGRFNYPVVGRSRDIDLSDINADGKIDLIVSHYNTTTFSTLLGNGDGTFQPAQITSTVSGPLWALPGDFNADGRADLAVISFNNQTVGVHFNSAQPDNSLVINSVATGNWSSPATWDRRVPTPADSVIINSGHTVTLDADAVIQNLTINGTLNGDSHRLNISGNWTNNGTFEPGTSAVTFSGESGTRSLTGIADTNFHDLTISNYGMLGYWKFDGNAEDATGHSHDGTPVNSPSYSAASLPSTHFTNTHALSLSRADNQRIVIPDSETIETPTALTWSVWVRPQSLADYEVVLGKPLSTGTSSQELLIFANGMARFFISDGLGNNCTADSLAGAISTGAWTHLAATWSRGSAATLYINGTVVANPPCAISGLPNTVQPLYIGDEGLASLPRYFDGLIDDVRVYNRALSAADVALLAQGETTQGVSTHITRPLTITGDLNLQAGTLDANGQAITINGNWTNGEGSFLPGSNTVTFAGTGAQNVNGDETFHNLVVNADSVLTTLNTVSLTGTLTNHGWTSETKPVSGTGPVAYSLGNITIDVTTQGTLTALQVLRRDTNHPNGQVGLQQTGRYWTIQTNSRASDFIASLTLPIDFPPTSSHKVCRYTGSTWDCARDSATSNSITRTGITAFSDWTIMTDVLTETAVTSSESRTPYGKSVTFTATVTAPSGTPSGTVTFFDGETPLGSAALDENGVATFTTSSLSAGLHAIRASYTGAGVYPPSSGTLAGGQTVDKALLTVKADDKTRAVRAANPALTYTVVGFIPGENASVLTGSPTLTTNANQSSAPGSYAITIGQGNLSAANYILTFVDGVLTVTGSQITLPVVIH